MPIEVIKQSDCHIVNYKSVFDLDAFSYGYSAIEDIVLRIKSKRLICDLTSVQDCTISAEQFEEIRGAMLRLFVKAPKGFQVAVAVRCEQLTTNVKKCHDGIRDAGLLHKTFVAKSLDEAIALLN